MSAFGSIVHELAARGEAKRNAENAAATRSRFEAHSAEEWEEINRREAIAAVGIHPTEYRVLVLPKPVDEVSKGGIIIPDQVKEQNQFAQMEGTIVAASPLAFTYAEWPDGARIPGAGDRVLFGKYSGAIVKGRDGKDYRLVNDRDISAVIE
jgi:chaperonin GroES